MSRKLSTKTQALADQIIAILRDEDGFPVSTHEVAAGLGDHLVMFEQLSVPQQPRPVCWPGYVVDQGRAAVTAWCSRCGRQHRTPVWRHYHGEDIRPTLNRLARDGRVEKVVIAGQRHHYWRRQDTDR